jgi:MATE family multidrug resistance protein
VSLAMPLVISTMSFTVMTFIERMFLTHYSLDAVAAAMPAAMLQFTLISFPLGVATYVNTFVAQYEGAGRPRQIGPVVWQGIWIGLLATALLLLTTPLAHAYFHHAGHDPDVVVEEIAYYDVLIFGSGAIILAGTLSSFFTGRGATRVVMAVDSTAAALNAEKVLKAKPRNLEAAKILGEAGCHLKQPKRVKVALSHLLPRSPNALSIERICEQEGVAIE